MAVQIIETNLRFSNIRKRSQTNRIIIHHTASPDVFAATIHQWHLNKKWSGIGYHYLIRANGSIERGRPENAIGAHAIPANGDGIGIVLTGNFEQDKPTSAQLDSLVKLVRDIQGRYGGKLKVLKHKDVDATACPGRNFPWQVFLQRLEEKGGDENLNLEEWQEKEGHKGVDYLVKEGLINNPEYWLPKLGDEVPVWLLFTLLKRIDERKGR